MNKAGRAPIIGRDEASHSDYRLWNAAILAAVSLFIIADTATQSFLSVLFFGDTAYGFGLQICFIIILFFGGIAFLQNDIIILAVLAIVVALLLSYYLYFIFGAHHPFSINSLGSYYGLLAIVVFYMAIKNNLLPSTIKILFYIYICYVILYIVLVKLYEAGALQVMASTKVDFVNTDYRGDRLKITHPAAAPFIVVYSIIKLQEKLRFSYVGTLVIASYAMYLAQSRGITVVTVTIVLLYMMTRRISIVQYISFISYLVLAIYMIYGLFEPSINPYAFSNTDTSTMSRYFQFQAVVPYIRVYPIFGIGIPDASIGLHHYLGQVVYPEDLGIIGILFIFGILGVILFGIFPVYLCCMQDVRRSSVLLGPTNGRTLALTGCIIGAYAAITSYNLLWNSSLLFSMIAATALYQWRLSALIKGANGNSQLDPEGRVVRDRALVDWRS